MANLSTRRWIDEVPFRNLSRSHGVPSSGFLMHVLAVGRFPWTWTFGTHGMGTTQYYFKGSAFAHPTSPILSAPRVSSLMSHPAVGLDLFNRVASQSLSKSCKNFSLSLSLVFFFLVYYYIGYSWFSMLCFLLLYIHLIHLQRDINKVFFKFLPVVYILFRWLECAECTSLRYSVGLVD